MHREIRSLKIDKNICASEDRNITSPEWVEHILRELCQGGCVYKGNLDNGEGVNNSQLADIICECFQQ